MRLATVSIGGNERIGAVEGDVVRLLPAGMGDMVAAIAAGRAEIERGLAASRETAALSAVRVLAPIRRFSRDVLCTGWNYWDHFEESRGKREGQDVDPPPRRPSSPRARTP
jgi:2-keto-4-pentenoate hydratase/2-oxohepta-3-ene-1,7-dioic acid hydratase in catechol pathway